MEWREGIMGNRKRKGLSQNGRRLNFTPEFPPLHFPFPRQSGKKNTEQKEERMEPAKWEREGCDEDRNTSAGVCERV